MQEGGGIQSLPVETATVQEKLISHPFERMAYF